MVEEFTEVAAQANRGSFPVPPQFEPEMTQGQSRITADAAEKIEMLAFQLLSITRGRQDNPELIAREAFISIDRCINSIANYH
jgi:hypothetical protein